MFKEERDETQFEWICGDIEKGQPNLSPMVHVAVYRLMQFTLRDILIRELGIEKTDRIIFEAGKKAGQEYGQHPHGEAGLERLVRRSPAHHERTRHWDLSC